MPTTAEPQAKMLYEHTSRPRWGLAVLAYVQGDRLGFQFEDGRLRVFKRRYFHLFRPAGRAEGLPDGLAADLKRVAKRKVSGLTTVSSSSRTRSLPKVDWAFEDQVALFGELYPEGFRGGTWAREMRGIDVKRRRKRHRGPSMREAQELLSDEEIDRLIAEDKHREVTSRLYAVLDGTSLVTPAQLRTLEGLSADDAVDAAYAIRELLHGDGPVPVRFSRFCRVVGPPTGKAGWQAATAPLAMMQPDEHVCVHRTTFREQAKLLSPEMRHPKRPCGASYEAYRTMAKRVKDLLVQADLAPRDLMDVHDFIQFTMRNKHRERLQELATSRQGAGRKATSAA